MIALDEQQLQRNAPVLGQSRRVGGDRHSVLHRRRAGREEPVGAGNFHDAHPAGANRREPSRWQSVGMYLPLALRRLQDGLPSSALISSPSMRMENFFGGKVFAPFLASRDNSLRRSAGSGSFRRARLRGSSPGRLRLATSARTVASSLRDKCRRSWTRFLRRFLLVFEFGENLVPAVRPPSVACRCCGPPACHKPWHWKHWRRR